MAEKKTVKSAPSEEFVEEVNVVETPKEEEKVAVFLPRIPDPNAPQEEFYSINFKNYLIRRGEKVYVPKELKAIIDEQMRAESEAIDYVSKLGIREA